MFSPLGRRLTFLTGVLFVALGGAMFVAPHWAARSFAWKVSPFLAMTIGAWYVGTGVFALECTRVGRLARTYAALVYVWLFAGLEALVVVVHANDLALGKALTWPYLVTLTVGVAAAVVGIVDVARTRPEPREPGIRNPLAFRVIAVAFVAAVTLLALPLLDGYDNPPSIWPGPLTLASARGFAAFFGSLALSSLLLVFARNIEVVLTYLRPAVVLNVVILVAALVFLGRFDFGDHPGQFLYVGLYVFVLVGAGVMLVYGVHRADAPVGQPSLR